jgi:hypothetical protein
MQASPTFARDYELVQFEAEGAHRALLWVKAQSSRIGVRWVADTLHAPGFLFRIARGQGVARLHEGRMVMLLEPGAVAARPVQVPAGRYRIVIEGAGREALRVLRGSTRVDEPGSVAIELDEPAELLLEVSAPLDARCPLGRIALVKQ